MFLALSDLPILLGLATWLMCSSSRGCGESSGLFLCATGKLSFQSCSVQEEHQLELAALLFVFTSRHGFHFLPTLLCTDFEKLQYLLLESDALINEASDSL